MSAEIGMLWFDNSKRDLAERVRIAVDYYQKKYGRLATRVYVGRGEVIPESYAGPVPVEIDLSLLPNSLWVTSDSEVEIIPMGPSPITAEVIAVMDSLRDLTAYAIGVSPEDLAVTKGQFTLWGLK